MARDVKVDFSIEIQRSVSKADILAKLKIDSSYGFFDEYEITNAEDDEYYEITAYIDKLDIDNISEFANNFNEYKSYIKSIFNEFLRCEISYYANVDKSMDYCVDHDDYGNDVEISYTIGFEFDLDKVEDFDSIEFIIDDIDCDSNDVSISIDDQPICNIYKNIFDDLHKLIASHSGIYTSWWGYEPDETIILTDYVKVLDRGIYVGDGKDQLIQLRDELNYIINQLD